MSNGRQSQETYASGLLREFLRGELKNKPNEVLEPVAGLIGDRDRLRLIMHYRSLWPRVKARDDADELPETFGETKLARRLVGNAGSVTLDEAVEAGNVSQMQGAIGLTGRERDGGDFFGEVASRLANEGAIGLVLGPPGSGKTATTLDIARAWAARTGGYLVGNTGWDGFDEVVTSDREMLEAMATREGPVLAVLDETAQDLSGYGEDAPKAEAFANALTFIRKREADHGPHAKRGSVLMVNHTRTRTAAAFRKLANFAVEKPSRGDPGTAVVLDSQGGQDTFDEDARFSGITDTREAYPEHEASEFIITDEAGTDDEADDGPDAGDVRRQEAIKTVVQACQPWADDAGMSYAEAAHLVDYGNSWVGDRVREWRDGQHRDLVAAPTEDSG